MAIHELLGARTVADSQHLQVALGKVRRASGHLQGRVLAIDPHRVVSFSKRHIARHRVDKAIRPTKSAQTFFVLDADTHQPVCFTTGTSARTASHAAEELLQLAADILDTKPGQTLVLAILGTSRSSYWTRSRRRRISTSWSHARPTQPPRVENYVNCPQRSIGVGRVSQRRRCLTPPKTARRDRSTNMPSGGEAGLGWGRACRGRYLTQTHTTSRCQARAFR